MTFPLRVTLYDVLEDIKHTEKDREGEIYRNNIKKELRLIRERLDRILTLLDEQEEGDE